MATKTTRETIDDAMGELEQLADEIHVKLHLGSMEAKDSWTRNLEPKLFEARQHAREAKDSSKKALDDVLAALKQFSREL
jgi:hypothetical protein